MLSYVFATVEALSTLLRAHWRDDHFKLRMAPAEADGGDGAVEPVEWVSAGAARVHRSEPYVPWLARLRLGLMSMFVPEDWL